MDKFSYSLLKNICICSLEQPVTSVKNWLSGSAGTKKKNTAEQMEHEASEKWKLGIN